jgi:hypothetical protein
MMIRKIVDAMIETWRRRAAAARHAAVRTRIGRVEGPTSLEDLRRDRARDGT